MARRPNLPPGSAYRHTPPLPSSPPSSAVSPVRPQVRQYAKFGIPPSLRPCLWRLMLGLPVEADNAQEKATFARLHEDVTRSDNTPTHRLVMGDQRFTVSSGWGGRQWLDPAVCPGVPV